MSFIAIFVQGFVLGIGAAVPIGPINILIINYALHHYWLAFGIGFGAMWADITYLTLLYLGIIHSEPSTIVLDSLALFGALFMFFLAVLSLQGAKKQIKKRSLDHKKSFIATFIKGYLLTLLNPYTVGFWLSVSSFVAIKEDIVPLLLGLFSAIVLWVMGMPYLVFRSKHLLGSQATKYLSYLSSVIFLLFGFFFLYEAIS
jgi:L-lysine exporter family protein LysE/ArgO